MCECAGIRVCVCVFVFVCMCVRGRLFRTCPDHHFKTRLMLFRSRVAERMSLEFARICGTGDGRVVTRSLWLKCRRTRPLKTCTNALDAHDRGSSRQTAEDARSGPDWTAVPLWLQ